MPVGAQQREKTIDSLSVRSHTDPMAEIKNPLRVLVVGAGAREHALVWKLKQSKRVERIFCAPGNPGINLLAKSVNAKPENLRGLSEFAFRNKINLTVVGPEKPLAQGITEEFRRRKLRIFGPDRKGAQLESSKAFAKDFMKRHHIPTAPFRVFTSAAEAIGFCKSVEFPVVIKADGLAAGKGVVIAGNLAEATAAIVDMIEKKLFGNAGSKIIVEAALRGIEVSLMAITDGNVILPLLPSQDHKRAYDDDRGPNTGGMGAYCPTPFLSESAMDRIQEHILQPTLFGLQKDSVSYQGIIYAGLMLTEMGPKLLEFNCRFGDPETQVVLPLLKSDFAELLVAAADKRLGAFGNLEWKEGAAATVVMAAKGYPGKYATGARISGLPTQPMNNTVVFHAGTKREANNWTTNGGRVLSVMATDATLQGAINRAYDSVRRIRFDGAQFRKDIGLKGLQTPTIELIPPPPLPLFPPPELLPTPPVATDDPSVDSHSTEA